MPHCPFCEPCMSYRWREQTLSSWRCRRGWHRLWYIYISFTYTFLFLCRVIVLFFFFCLPDLMETKSKPTRQSVHWHRNGNLPGVLTPRSETPRRWTPIWSWCHVWWVWLNLPLKNKKGPVKSANATNLKRRLQKTPLKLIMLYMGQSQILFSDNYG